MTTSSLVVKRLFIVTLFLVATGLCQPQAMAWGAKGHQIIARVAAEQLSSRARKDTADLLGKGASLESVAAWADSVRGSSSGHFVLIPLHSNGYNPDHHCPGDCLIKSIEHNISVLSNFNESVPKRAVALRYVIHLIGDLHQPLHCADDNDAGGSKVRVYFYGQPTNLHNVWDVGIINRSNLKPGAYAEQISKSMGGKSKSSGMFLRGTLVDWALDTHRLAPGAYQVGEDKKLGEEYYERNRPVVDEQLAKAGARLAKVLNDIFQ